MPTDWRSVRITLLCAPSIDPVETNDLLVQIINLVRERYPNKVANVYVDLPEPPDLLGHVRGSREGPAGA